MSSREGSSNRPDRQFSSASKGKTPHRKRGGMKLMSDEEMMRVEIKREHEKRHGSSSSLPASSRRLDLGDRSKRPHSNLDGGGGSDSKVSVSVTPSPPAKKKKKTRTPAGPGSNTSLSSSSAPAAPVPRPQHAATAADAGAAGADAAAAGVTGALSVHPASVAHRGDRGAGAGVEMVRQVSVEERIAENQRRRGVIDIRHGNGLTRPSMPLAARARPIPPRSVAPAVARRSGGDGGGARRGGGVACNLAAAEGWTQEAAPPSIDVPVKLESSAARGTGSNVPAGLPAPATPVAASAAPAPAAAPPSANGGRGGRKVSVSDMFRVRGVRFDIQIAARVGKEAKRMFVQERGKPAGRALRKRPALDRYLQPVSAPWSPGNFVMENTFSSRYRGMLLEAFDSVVGRAP